MLKSEEAFERFLSSRPEGHPREEAEMLRLLDAFMAGGDFGAQFVIDIAKQKHGAAPETKVNLPEIPPGTMPPDPGPDPTKLEYDEWVACTKECPACHGQGCEPHETDEGRLICGPGCARCEGAGRIPL